MEVHHHPNVEKKNFKEYFLKFLMIFLAVTMGFFAENLRETIKDKNEIEENIQSVLADLESDLAHFNSVLNIDTYSYTTADSLINLLHNDISNTPEIYLYGRTVTANISSSYSNSKTFDLMKAAGTLKLIRPRKLLDSLGLYYVTFLALSQQDNLVRLKQDAVNKNNHLLFDSYVFSQMKIEYDSVNTSHAIVHPPFGHPVLLSTDYKEVNEVALAYYYLASAEKFTCRLAQKQKILAERLIEIIKQEYHLENE
jgi:hypothetical protein